MLMRLSLALFAFVALAPGQARQVPVIPYDSMMADKFNADGEIDREEPEYPASLADKASGLTVSWGFDDSLIYVGLETKGRGWMAIGFGSDKMHEANMLIGYYTEDSTEVVNQIGANYTHANSPMSDSAIREAEVEFDEETGVTTMEFAYPLQFPNVKGLAVPGLVPGDTADVILAQNTKTPSLSVKHTNKNVLRVRLAENPHLTK